MTAAMATEMPVQIKSMAMLSNAKSVQLAPRFMTTRTTDASAMATPDTQTPLLPHEQERGGHNEGEHNEEAHQSETELHSGSS